METFFDMIESVDLLILGRGMWNDYCNYWQAALTNTGNFTQNEKDYARYAEKTRHIVFSNTLKDSGWQNAIIMGGSIRDEVLKLKDQPGKDIQIVGGAKLASTLINSDLVDEYRLEVNPVILHTGKSLFTGLLKNQILKLKSANHLKSGVVILTYKTAT